MAEKTFFDIFKRYAPTAEKRAVLADAVFARNPKKIMGDEKSWELELNFPRHVDAELLY